MLELQFIVTVLHTHYCAHYSGLNCVMWVSVL